MAMERGLSCRIEGALDALWRTKRPEPSLWARLGLRRPDAAVSPPPLSATLGSCCKNGRIDGFKFRRQHAIETYIVDFYCAEANLVIEVDGSIHDATGAGRYRQNDSRNLGLPGYPIHELTGPEQRHRGA